MRIKFRGIEYIYDTENDRCTVVTPQETRKFENPFEGYNAFLSDITFLLRHQIEDEIVKNGRNKWTGMKEETK